MATFTLTIKLGNDAMSTSEHVAIALRDAAFVVGQGYNVERGSESGAIIDYNGSTVGGWKVTL